MRNRSIMNLSSGAHSYSAAFSISGPDSPSCIAVDTALSAREEFPSITGAYRIAARRDNGEVMDVHADLFTRADMRCVLALDGKTLSKTWIYQYFP